MRKFGLIGKSLQHSFSPKYFSEKFEKESIKDATYSAFEIPVIEDFPSLIKSEQPSGLNVTIPYKQEVIPFLDHLSPLAEEIGAVNTISFKNGVLTGHNTDALGFAKSIKPFFKQHHERALILGTGGANKAVTHVFQSLGVRCLTVSRSPEGMHEIGYDELHHEGMKHWPIIVNCTPLGTHPDIDEMPNIPMEGIGENHFCIDLIYNPSETKFLSFAKTQGAMTLNGYDMLQFQAEAAWDIWNK